MVISARDIGPNTKITISPVVLTDSTSIIKRLTNNIELAKVSG